MAVEKKIKLIIDILFFGIFLTVFYFILKYVFVWLLPFIIGFIIASAIQRPIEALFKKTRVPKCIWSFLFVSLIFIALIWLITIFIARLYNESADFLTWAVSQSDALKDAFDGLGEKLARFIDYLPDALSESLRGSLSNVADALISLLTSFLTFFTKNVIVYVPGFLLITVLSAVASCFIANSYSKIVNFILCQFGAKNQELILKSKRLISESILKMLRGYAAILLITFIELLLGLSLAGIKYPLIISFIIAVLDILPVIGTGTVLIPWAAVNFLTSNSSQGIKILVLYIIITVVRNIIEPKIIGSQIGLFPLVTLISMYLGIKLFGFSGIFTLPLITIVLVQLQRSGVIKLWNTPDEENPQQRYKAE